MLSRVKAAFGFKRSESSRGDRHKLVPSKPGEAWKATYVDPYEVMADSRSIRSLDLSLDSRLSYRLDRSYVPPKTKEILQEVKQIADNALECDMDLTSDGKSLKEIVKDDPKGVHYQMFNDQLKTGEETQTYKFRNGDTFTGRNLKRGEMPCTSTGKIGECVLSMGQGRYVGEGKWAGEDDLPKSHGRGQFIYSENSMLPEVILVGEFRNGKFISGERYDPEQDEWGPFPPVAIGLPSGLGEPSKAEPAQGTLRGKYGTLKPSGGGLYQGMIRQGVAHGYGTYYAPDGKRFDGNFKSGYAHGDGRLLSMSSGVIACGKYKHGMPPNKKPIGMIPKIFEDEQSRNTTTNNT